jgi:hypothetical protein
MRLQLNDTVRIVRLLTPEREVTGSAAEPPQPRVGEIGAIVDDVGDDLYLVERVTADGYTSWLAEFARDELELVARSPRDGLGSA